jgi:AcrR family transcriptional regulator
LAKKVQVEKLALSRNLWYLLEDFWIRQRFRGGRQGCCWADSARGIALTGASEPATASRAERSEAFYKLRPGPGKPAAEVAEHQCSRVQRAMLEIVSERGYGEVTVRELAQRAGISSRAFYQRYTGKEDCFLRTHELIVRRIVRRVIAAQAGQTDWRECLRATVHTFLDELQREPRAARLLLVDAYAAGSVALDQVRGAERTFEMRISECFVLATKGSPPPSQLARGIVVGIMGIARFEMVKNREPNLTQLAEELTSWAASVIRTFLAENVPSRLSLNPASLNPSITPKFNLPREASSNERVLIVAALTKLAAIEGYEEMTVRKIRASAGASSKKFSAHFVGVADCFQEAIDLYVDSFPSQSYVYEGVENSLGPSRVDPIMLLCKCVAGDPAFATLCFVDVFTPGEMGVHSLERFVREISQLLARGESDYPSLTTASEASAAAIWGSLREEIICGRRPQLTEQASQLQHLALTLPERTGCVSGESSGAPVARVPALAVEA